MFDFPESTVFDHRIPKLKFYEHLQVNNKLEQLFIREIDKIVWKYKLSPETLNVASGKYIDEIEFLEVRLKQEKISHNIIEQIDREIPYHVVFIINYDNKNQLWISYKERHKNKEGKFRVETYFKTDWTTEENLILKIEGLNLDQVYESFIQQIGEDKIEFDENEGLKKAVEKSKKRDRLKKKIEKLENRIEKEKQFKKQVSMMSEIRQLRAQLDSEQT